MKKFYTDWDEFKDAQMCNAWVAAAIVGAGALTAGASIFGSSKASKAQQDATNAAAETNRQALDFSKSVYNQTRADLAPYRAAGESATSELESRLPYLTSDIDVSKLLADPNSTPAKAYDFTKTQGLKAVANSAAARGLGVSGAALKGAANFTTGLADNTYTNLFNLENTNRSNAFNRLKALVDTGAGAATGTAASGAAAASTGEKSSYNIGQAQIGGGNAAAAGYNAAGGAVGNFVNNVGGYAVYKGLYGNNNNYDTTNGMQPFLDEQAASTRAVA